MSEHAFKSREEMKLSIAWVRLRLRGLCGTWLLCMRMSATAKEVEAQGVPVVRDSSVRNPLAFEKARRAALTPSDGFAQWV